jgi:hypothetical protein
MEYRRAKIAGGTYFFTVVTHNRRPYNPVRHRLVKCVHQWQYSSFHREVKHGRYRSDWGCNCGSDRHNAIDINIGWVDEGNPTHLE